jgi:hypothetical protein
MTRRTVTAALVAIAAIAGAAPAPFAGAAGAPSVRPGEEDRPVTVLVIDEVTGQPLSGWKVIIGPRGPFDFWHTGRTGNTGTARFLLPPGEYRAWVTQGGPQVWGASFTTGDDQTRVVVRVNPYED